jgi:hypothetical protein
MYTLYYISESLQISTLEVEDLNTPVLIPENLTFIALRKGINFINEPHECINFTQLERLAIAGKLDDINIFKDYPFRKKNTLLLPLCQIDQYFAMNFRLGKGENFLFFDFESNERGFEVTELYNDSQRLPHVESVIESSAGVFFYRFNEDYWSEPLLYKGFILTHVSSGRSLKFIYPNIDLVGYRDEAPIFYVEPSY